MEQKSRLVNLTRFCSASVAGDCAGPLRILLEH
jgi:hypothetical protein